MGRRPKRVGKKHWLRVVLLTCDFGFFLENIHTHIYIYYIKIIYTYLHVYMNTNGLDKVKKLTSELWTSKPGFASPYT